MFVLVLAGCFRIVVNVHFPEAEAKEAITTMEKELLKGSESPKKDKSEKDKEKSEKKAPDKKDEKSKSSLLYDESFLSSTVYAGEVNPSAILDRVKSRTDVKNAYKRRSERLSEVKKLLDSGKAGEGNDGYLKPRGPDGNLSKSQKKLIETENEDRKIIIKAVYEAILKIKDLEPNSDVKSRFLPSAQEAFAAAVRERARQGWWIQLSNGKWKRK